MANGAFSAASSSGAVQSPTTIRTCVASGRFAEAVEQWEQWERLASRSDAETAQLDQVRRAKAAAQTLVGAGVSSHG